MRALRWRIKGSVGCDRVLIACQRENLGATTATRVRLVVLEFDEPLPRVVPRFPDLVSHEKEFI